MTVENIMYFALGLLASGLVALMLGSAIWHRAVRLTRKRIEAATPVSLAEFRADKDQLRARFAIEVRKLEVRIESLTARLAGQVAELDSARIELDGLRAGRKHHQALVDELETRAAELSRRVIELERESTDLAQRLRMRERELADRVLAASNGVKTNVVAANGSSVVPPEDELVDAEGSITSAESQLRALLEQTREIVADKETLTEHLLAEKLSLEDRLDALKSKVMGVESAILTDWGSDRASAKSLRRKLGDIALSVTQYVYEAENEQAIDLDESLFEKVRRFAGDGVGEETMPVPPVRPRKSHKSKGSLSARMATLEGARQRRH